MLEFVWDREKAAANLAKHGVDFEDALTAFDDPLSITVVDPDHSHGERGSYLSVTAGQDGSSSLRTQRAVTRFA